MKAFVGSHQILRERIIELLANGNEPMTVNNMAKIFTKNGVNELVGVVEANKFRQLVQNVTDRLVRHGELEIVFGTKRTGRPVKNYRTVTANNNNSSDTNITIDDSTVDEVDSMETLPPAEEVFG